MSARDPRRPAGGAAVEPGARTSRGPLLALAAIVVIASLGYGAAAQLVERPLLNPDELRYVLAARAVAEGGWLELRGSDYGYGPVYPVVLAPVIALAGGVEPAYGLLKLLNAFLFALAAVPIYLLARRLLSPWWSVGVAALSVAIPSSIYTSLVLTESASYLVASAGLLAVVLALERPSPARQAAMLGVVALASATRVQLAALAVAFLAGWVLLWALDVARPPLGRALARLWPTLGALALAGGVLAARALASSPDGVLGGYGDLWRGYDAVAVAQFAAYHLAGWGTYLFVAPLVVAPIVVARLLGAACRGARREGAFAVTFLTASGAFLLIAAAFASTPYGYEQLHDRYLFYLAPLWLVVLGVWLSDGLPRPPLSTAVGVASAVLLGAVVPFGLLTGNTVFEALPTALWSEVWDAVEGTPHVDGRRMYGAVVLLLAATTVVLPRRLWPLVPAALVAGFGATGALAWHRLVAPSEAFSQPDTPPRTWVDDALPDGVRATKLYRSPRRCPYTESMRHALFLTEFFNGGIDRVAKLGDSTPDGLPVERVEVGSGGRLVLTSGAPLVAEYVVTQPDVVLAGSRIGRGTAEDLVLWETRGVVRLAGDENGAAAGDCDS